MKKIFLSIALLALIGAGASAKAGNPRSAYHKPRKVQIEVNHHNFYPNGGLPSQVYKNMRKHHYYQDIDGVAKHIPLPSYSNQ
jgi:hypothetical protein